MAFNSKQYSWSSVKVFMFGRLVTGIRGVSYTAKQEKEVVHGAGNEPLSIQPGNKTYEGSITLLQSEKEAIMAEARRLGYADPTDMPGFEIAVSYFDIPGLPTNDVLLGCEFTEWGSAMKQGDKFMETELPFIFIRLKRA
ncbi:MAG: hypothetical protein HC896_00270 [Bacteroidales bacterium]|nr:hypothetical protein [Bacteroidales bacterium]